MKRKKGYTDESGNWIEPLSKREAKAWNEADARLEGCHTDLTPAVP